MHIVSLWIAGINRLEDLDIYSFEPAVPAEAGTLNKVAVNSDDEVLKSLLRADVLAKDSCIAGWEDHKANLPRDPTQVCLQTLNCNLPWSSFHVHFQERGRGVQVLAAC